MATKAKPEYPWYQIVSGDDITQGDILSNCPILAPNPDEVLLLAKEGKAENLDIPLKRGTLVIMTQACDIEHSKVESIVLCPVWPLEAFSKDAPQLASDKGKEDLRRGYFPPFHLLNKDDDFRFDFHVVDFREQYSLPTGVVKLVAKKAGDRLRVLAPYREHLSQSFARYFMRVGLPLDIPPFRKA